MYIFSSVYYNSQNDKDSLKGMDPFPTAHTIIIITKHISIREIVNFEKSESRKSSFCPCKLLCDK